MNLTGEVVSLNLDTTAKNQRGTDYPAWQMIFKDRDGKVKDITKHINSLKYTKGLREGLEALKPGDMFTAVLEKKGDFNEITQVVKGADVAAATPAAQAATGRVTGSNYETPQEREWNRVRIVRQSAINYAINLLKTDKHTPPVEDVLSLATRFAAFVNEKPDEA
jgi:hypothetical protein